MVQKPSRTDKKQEWKSGNISEGNVRKGGGDSVSGRKPKKVGRKGQWPRMYLHEPPMPFCEVRLELVQKK